MRNPVFNLRVSQNCKDFLNDIKKEYGATAGVNRLVEAIYQFCIHGDSGDVNVRGFFDDALSGRLQDPATMKSRLREAEEEEYTKFSDWLKGDYGDGVLQMMCEKNTAAEFFANSPNWLGILQEQFLDSDNGMPLRLSVIQKYTSRWYQERIADGSAAEYLRSNIRKRSQERIRKMDEKYG